MFERDFVEEAAERLTPPEPDAFFQRLWTAIDTKERATTRRWRTLAIFSAVIAAAAVSAVGVFALSAGSTIVDRTVSCPIPFRAGIPVFLLLAETAGKTSVAGQMHTVPGLVWVGVDPAFQQSLVSLSGGKAGYAIDRNSCSSASSFPLEPGALPKYGTFQANQLGGVDESCFSSSRVRVRLRVTFAKATGVPVAAKLAIRNEKTLKPIAFIDWTPKRETAFLSSSCSDR